MDLRNVVVSALLVFAVVLRQHGAEASQMCYVCSYTMSGDPSRDYECVNDPAKVKTGAVKIMCDKWCTVHKVTQRGSGKIWSFSRQCEDHLKEQCVPGSYYEYTRSCDTDLCNSENGETIKCSDVGPTVTTTTGGGGGGGGINSVSIALLILTTLITVFRA